MSNNSQGGVEKQTCQTHYDKCSAKRIPEKLSNIRETAVTYQTTVK